MSLFKRKAKSVTNLGKRTKSLDRISEESVLHLQLDDNISQDSIYQETMPQPSTSQNAQIRESLSIIESLKIPDVIKDLQTFNGNPKLLQNFIENVEEILLLCRGYNNTPQGTIFLRAIRNKIIGEANESLNSYLTPLVWETIKENLLITYGDKRDETTLIKELHNLNQDFMSVENFYTQIVEIQSALLNRIANTENNRTVFEAKKKLYVDMCLNSFNTGIRGPLGSMLRSMQPRDLSTVYAYIIKEKSITYKNRYETNNRQDHQYRPQYRYTPSFNPFNNRSQFNNSQPTYNNRQNFNNNRQNFNYNRQQINNNMQHPNQQNTNNFRNTNNQQFPQIKQSESAMYRNNNNNSRNTSYSRQSRNPKIEEIHNISNEPLDEPEQCNIEEQQNFQRQASSIQQL